MKKILLFVLLTMLLCGCQDNKKLVMGTFEGFMEDNNQRVVFKIDESSMLIYPENEQIIYFNATIEDDVIVNDVAKFNYKIEDGVPYFYETSLFPKATRKDDGYLEGIINALSLREKIVGQWFVTVDDVDYCINVLRNAKYEIEVYSLNGEQMDGKILVYEDTENVLLSFEGDVDFSTFGKCQFTDANHFTINKYEFTRAPLDVFVALN